MGPGPWAGADDHLDTPLLGSVTMGRKSAMAFPSSPCSAAAPVPNGGVIQSRRPAASSTGHRATEAECQGEHQLEKLEFALAVALTRGDVQRSEQLRHQIDALGGNREEPGT